MTRRQSRIRNARPLVRRRACPSYVRKWTLLKRDRARAIAQSETGWPSVLLIPRLKSSLSKKDDLHAAVAIRLCERRGGFSSPLLSSLNDRTYNRLKSDFSSTRPPRRRVESESKAAAMKPDLQTQGRDCEVRRGRAGGGRGGRGGSGKGNRQFIIDSMIIE